MGILSVAFSLFLLIDAVGNVPLFISFLKGINAKRRLVIIFRELLIALGIMIFVCFAGEWLLKALGIDHYSVKIAGGIILFLLALKMIFSSETDKTQHRVKEEPLIAPLAIPFVAGPAVLATIMVYSRQDPTFFIIIPAIILAWAASTVILLGSSFLQNWLGSRGILACERLMGLILTLIAVQMFLEGVSHFVCKISS